MSTKIPKFFSAKPLSSSTALSIHWFPLAVSFVLKQNNNGIEVRGLGRLCQSLHNILDPGCSQAANISRWLVRPTEGSFVPRSRESPTAGSHHFFLVDLHGLQVSEPGPSLGSSSIMRAVNLFLDEAGVSWYKKPSTSILPILQRFWLLW